jgi:hypothetical protein
VLSSPLTKKQKPLRKIEKRIRRRRRRDWDWDWDWKEVKRTREDEILHQM